MKHQERVQTLCDVTMHYFGSALKLDYERTDPRDEVLIQQQHCGGNALVVFREQIRPHSQCCFSPLTSSCLSHQQAASPSEKKHSCDLHPD